MTAAVAGGHINMEERVVEKLVSFECNQFVVHSCITIVNLADLYKYKHKIDKVEPYGLTRVWKIIIEIKCIKAWNALHRT